MSFLEYFLESFQKDLTYKVSYVEKGKPKVGFLQAKNAKEAENKARKKKKQVTKAEVSSIQKE